MFLISSILFLVEPNIPEMDFCLRSNSSDRVCIICFELEFLLLLEVVNYFEMFGQTFWNENQCLFNYFYKFLLIIKNTRRLIWLFDVVKAFVLVESADYE